MKMIKKLLLLLVVATAFAAVLPNTAMAQCPNTNTGPSCSTFNGGSLAVGVRTFVCDLWGGEYTEVSNLGAGNTYRVDFCGILSSPAPSYNSFMTIYTGGGTLVASNDDFCGNDPQIDFVATAGGTYRFLANISGACASGLNINTPLAITLLSLGASPEIDVRGNSVSIATGDVTPSAADHTDFGTANTCFGTIVRTFTIANTGTSSLNLSGSPRVAVSGPNASDFTVTTQPATPISNGGTTTFVVTFDPSANGVRVATLTIANDDANENPYTFTIQGTGADSEINVQGNSVTIANNDFTPSLTDHTDFGSQSVCTGLVSRTYTIQNQGSQSLSVSTISFSGPNAADFSVTAAPSGTVAPAGTTTLIVSFNPSGLGVRTANIAIANSDCDETNYTFQLQGTGIDPEINVQGNAINIVDGDASPTTTDFTDFGSQAVCTGSITRTFTIQNSGTTALSIGAVSLSGTHAADYSVSTAPSVSVVAAGSTTFAVTFNPSAAGLRNATVSIVNGDCNENPYDFALAGTGIDAEINVQGNANTIVDGDVTPSLVDHTDFGSQSVCSGTVVRTFTIQNTGVSALPVGTVTISGANAADFTVGTPPASSVNAAGSTTFTIVFNPSAAGVRSANISFTNGDCDESPFDFAIQGTGVDPEVNVQGNSVSIANNDVSPSTSDHTDFGTTSVCSGTIARTFTIQNTGTGILNVGTVTVSGPGASDFTVTTPPAASVAPSGTTTFVVTFNPSVPGLSAAALTFTNNDCDEASYSFAIAGTGTDAEVNVQGNSVTIADGDVSPSLTDHTDFGSQSVCAGTITRTFTIQNIGTVALNVGTVSITGANASEFSLGSAPSSTVAAASSTTFSVIFNPGTLGLKTATISFTNSDCDETPYDFSIQGTGVDPEINVSGNSVTIADGDVTPSATDHTDFGTASVCAGSVARTFTVQNAPGTASLTLGTVTISGANAADFTVTLQPTSPVSISGSTTFTVSFNPSASGVRNATISLSSNDCDEANYDFAVQGTGNDPEVNVVGNSTTIVNGDVTPSLGDHTDFGTQLVCSGSITRLYSIQNTGSAVMSLGTVTISGPNASDFTVTTSPGATVNPLALGPLAIAFDPSGGGLRTATVSFSNNDCDEANFSFAIQGFGDNSATAPVVSGSPNGVTVCEGSSTSFSVTASGAGLSYQWQFNNGGGFNNLNDGGIYSGATTNTLNISAANTGISGTQYQVLVFNACGSVPSSPATLTVDALPSIQSQSSSGGVCIGNPIDFQCSATGTGISYQWQVNTGSGFVDLVDDATYSGSSTNMLSISSVLASMDNFLYQCVVSGTCNPADTTSIMVLSAFQAPTVQGSLTEPSCNGGSNGQIVQTVSGAGGYTYLWSNSATTQDLSGVGAGTYSCTIADVNGCESIESYTLGEPSVISLSSTALGSCDGSANGCIDLTAIGGTPGFSYVWDNGFTVEDTCAYPGGSYNVTVTDANGCTATSNVVVPTIPNPVVSISLSGTILTANGGPFVSYQWFDNGVAVVGGTNSTLSFSASPGNYSYSVAVVDSNGCIGNDTLNFVIVGLMDPQSGLGLEIYPNPGSEQVAVRLIGGDAQVYRLEVLDLTGKSVLGLDVADGNEAVQLNVGKLPAGVYMVRATFEGGALTRKLVKQ